MDLLRETRWLPPLFDTLTGDAMETFDNYQHTYMCMLIIIRIMDIIKK